MKRIGGPIDLTDESGTIPAKKPRLAEPLISPSVPAPAPARLKRVLFLGHREDDAGIIEGMERFVFEETAETDPAVLSSVLSTLDEANPARHFGEEGIEHIDIFNWLAGEWESPRPPACSSSALWFLPRSALGSWTHVDDVDAYSFIHKGPWDDVIEFTAARHKSEDGCEGSESASDEDQVTLSDWEEAKWEHEQVRLAMIPTKPVTM